MRTAASIAALLLCLGCTEGVAHPEGPNTNTAAAPVTTTAPAAVETTAPPAPPAVNGPKLRPVDEGATDPELAAYRQELLAAVRARDVERIVALSDPKIRTDFGSGGGSDSLRRILRNEKTIADLEQLLTLGGTFSDEGAQRSFRAPYVYSAWPRQEDAFESFAVLGENVPLRESNGRGAATIATLSYDIVGRSGAPGTNVKTADGRSGWVDPQHLRSPIGYRALFTRSSGTWRMNALVAGD